MLEAAMESYLTEIVGRYFLRTVNTSSCCKVRNLERKKDKKTGRKSEIDRQKRRKKKRNKEGWKANMEEMY